MLGILLGMAILLVANFFELTGIKWIYSNVCHAAAIELIVIFQPELRKIFEQTASLKRSMELNQGTPLLNYIPYVFSNIFLSFPFC